MKVVYDYQIFASQRRGGISRYFVSLAEAMQNIDGYSPVILSPVYVNRHLKENRRAPRWGVYVPSVRGTALLRNVLCRASTNVVLSKRPPKIVHQTYFAPDYSIPSGVAVITTLYDMIPERLYRREPYWAEIIEMKARAVRGAQRVLCISESTRRDAIELIGGPEEKYVVTHLGCDEGSSVAHMASPLVDGPYLLYVGGRGWYKNFRRFISSYASSATLKRDFLLVCAGGGRITEEEASEFDRLRIDRKRVVQLDVDDESLISLYKNAVALVYPSEYEGFGLPPLEAMKVGCPVICSASSSMPEVVGEAGRYFQPADESSMTEAIESAVYSRDTLTAMAEAGRNRAVKFTWARCAADTSAVYESFA